VVIRVRNRTIFRPHKTSNHTKIIYTCMRHHRSSENLEQITNKIRILPNRQRIMYPSITFSLLFNKLPYQITSWPIPVLILKVHSWSTHAYSTLFWKLFFLTRFHTVYLFVFVLIGLSKNNLDSIIIYIYICCLKSELKCFDL
jgi:hypothetical protein